jgi:hypothetical protein
MSYSIGQAIGRQKPSRGRSRERKSRKKSMLLTLARER